MLPGIFSSGRKGPISMRRKSSEIVVRMTTLALLSALGFVLMAFAKIEYPPAPWLKIEISDMVVLIAYAMYGFFGGFSVAIIKTVLDLAVWGPVGLGIGNITALFTSCMFLLGLFLTSHVFHWFRKGLGFRILSYLFITLLVTISLTALNAIFITPSYLTVFGEHPHFSTCFDPGAIENVVHYFHGKNVMVDQGSYIGIISLIYGPFNLLKASICFVTYELVFNRLIFVLVLRSPRMQKYFSTGAVFSDKRGDGQVEEKKEQK